MNKKKVLFTTLSVIIAAALSATAAEVNWGADLTDAWVNAPGTTQAEAGWLVQLYMVGDAAHNMGDIVGFDPDTLLPIYDPSVAEPDSIPGGAVFQTEITTGRGGTEVIFGAFGLDWTAVEDQNVYTVIFSASAGNITADSWALVLDPSSFFVPKDSVGLSYDQSHFLPGGELANTWVPVPEPSSVMLGLTGFAVMGRKLLKRRKKA